MKGNLMEDQVIHLEQVPMDQIPQPLWDDRILEPCREETIKFFTAQSLRERRRLSSTMADRVFRDGILSNPMEYRLNRIEAQFLTRIPDPILGDLLSFLTLGIQMGVREVLCLPFSSGKREWSTQEDSLSNLPWASVARQWVEGARQVSFETGEILIPPLTQVGILISHPPIRDDLEEFVIRLSLRGTLKFPRS